MLKKYFWEKNKLNYALVAQFAFFNGICAIINAELLRRFTNLMFDVEKYRLIRVMAGFCLMMLGTYLSQFFYYRAVGRFKKKAMLQYKGAVYRRIASQSAEDFSKNNVADYLALFSNDLPVIEANFVCGYVNMTNLIFSFVMGSLAIIYYNVWIYMIVLVFSALALLVSKVFGTKLARVEKQISDSNSRFLALLKDIFTGFGVVKSYQISGAMGASYDRSSEHVEEEKRKRTVANGNVDLASSAVSGVMNLLVLLLCGISVLYGGLKDGGVAIALIQLLGNVTGPIQMVGSMLALKKSAEILIDKADHMLKPMESQKEDGKEPLSFEKEITLDHLSVRFGEQEVLKDFTYTFEKNKKYLLTGESGSGKTTIFNVLQKFLTDYRGKVAVDGVDFEALEEGDLYPLFSYASQNVFIFNDTVENNITLFGNYSKEELEGAVRFAMLEDLIGEKSLQFSCGEDGKNLSGGERQRIALARCILRRKPILLLDEITSALDPGIARQIEKNLQQMEGVTIISICHHRIGDIHDKYDAVIQLSGGQAMESAPASS